MEPKSHWENVYATKAATAVSWFQAHADLSLRLIAETGASTDASIIDVGGGASTLVDDLLARGYTSLCVLDLSAAALNAARARLGRDAEQVRWIEGDITSIALPAHAYDLWHDRAVFHFLTGEAQRRAYVAAVLRSVKPGGHVIVSTFGEEALDAWIAGHDFAKFTPQTITTAEDFRAAVLKVREQGYMLVNQYIDAGLTVETSPKKPELAPYRWRMRLLRVFRRFRPGPWRAAPCYRPKKLVPLLVYAHFLLERELFLVSGTGS